MISKVGRENVYRLLELQKAKAIFDQDHDLELILEETKSLAQKILENREPIYRNELAVNGNDLKTIGLSGKAIKSALEYLLHQVYLRPELNQKDSLFQLIKNYDKTNLT